MIRALLLFVIMHIGNDCGPVSSEPRCFPCDLGHCHPGQPVVGCECVNCQTPRPVVGGNE